MLTEPAQVKQTETRSASAQPKLIYKPFAQKLTFICKFCGGKSCKHENWLTHPTSAIKGLNSDWVTSNILATQRPSTRINKEFNIIQAFKDNDINAIFNLQEPGEHPFCGDGIHEQSGFSYFPEEFYEHGIYFFNFGWKDMTATSTDVIIKILKQMSFSLADGHKIAIHCHAGRGRTGLMIASWLIYHHHMTAKEAISIVRSKRKGSIQSKSQEQVLFKLEKELKESRIIFHASPKFKLEDFLFHQKKILPLSDQSETRFVPNLVLLSLERLETLMTSGLATSRDIALAFSSPNDATYFKGEWNANHEKTLKSLKEQINTGSFKISEIDDPRYLAQGLLDYFDHFASPAIRNQFIDVVHSQIHNQDKLTREMKDKFFKQVDRKEFLLIECFAKFFSKLIDKDESIIEFVKKAVFRVCISLVLERKKWDKLFLKRSLIKDHHSDDRVSHLHIFVLKWVENFNKSFTDHFIMSTSPLKISEQRVLQKMDRVSRKHGTYLGRALNPHGDGSDRSSPTFSQGDFSPLKPSGKEQAISTGTFPPINNQQIDQQTGKPTDPRSNSPDFNANPAYLPLIPLGRNHRNASPGSDNLSSMVHSNGELLPDSINMNSEPGSKHQTVLSPIQIRGQSSSYSPTKNRSKTTIVKTSSPQPRVSLLEGHENLFVGESNLGDNTLKKNYDKFFSDNALFSEDTPREKMEDVSEESEGSELSDRENFMGLVEEIDKLSLKKKQMILDKLVREIQAENALAG